MDPFNGRTSKQHGARPCPVGAVELDTCSGLHRAVQLPVDWEQQFKLHLVFK